MIKTCDMTPKHKLLRHPFNATRKSYSRHGVTTNQWPSTELTATHSVGL